MAKEKNAKTAESSDVKRVSGMKHASIPSRDVFVWTALGTYDVMLRTMEMMNPESM